MWTNDQREEYLKQPHSARLTQAKLLNGVFSPHVYVIPISLSPPEASRSGWLWDSELTDRQILPPCTQVNAKVRLIVWSKPAGYQARMHMLEAPDTQGQGKAFRLCQNPDHPMFMHGTPFQAALCTNEFEGDSYVDVDQFPAPFETALENQRKRNCTEVIERLKHLLYNEVWSLVQVKDVMSSFRVVSLDEDGDIEEIRYPDLD